ncbi:hypothetical protein LEMLEM_LOCUS1961, partial [Lemmus lemmus]
VSHLPLGTESPGNPSLVFVCAHVDADALPWRPGTSEPLELELQATVCYLTRYRKSNLYLLEEKYVLLMTAAFQKNLDELRPEAKLLRKHCQQYFEGKKC